MSRNHMNIVFVGSTDAPAEFERLKREVAGFSLDGFFTGPIIHLILTWWCALVGINLHGKYFGC